MSYAMGEHTNIEWCHASFNPWRGCSKVSPGCTHCYAETLAARFPGTLGVWGDKGARVVAAESYWRQPLRWNRAAQKAGERRRVFCASLADVFEDRHELVATRARLWKLIAATPHLDWLLLTKRPQNIDHLWRMAHEHARPWSNELPRWLPNVWLGVSVEDQARANERIPLLLKVPAAVRFVSIEPMLGPVALNKWLVPQSACCGACVQNAGWCPGCDRSCAMATRPDLVICGGESGPGARPMHPDWARSLRDQCKAAGVPFLMKQWGEWHAGAVGGGCDTHVRVMYRDGRVCEVAGDALLDTSMPLSMRPNPAAGGFVMSRVGKARAGRKLDGVLHDEYPTPRKDGGA